MTEWNILLDSFNHLILESINNGEITIESKYFDVLNRNYILLDEVLEYDNKYRDFKDKIDVLIENHKNTRRSYFSWNNKLDSNEHCISLIHLLKREDKIVLKVYMRSSDLERLRSDLGFLCRIAKEYEADILHLCIGSLHLYLEDYL